MREQDVQDFLDFRQKGHTFRCKSKKHECSATTAGKINLFINFCLVKVIRLYLLGIEPTSMEIIDDARCE